MKYVHTFIDGGPCELPVGKVVCVGRNYAAHARELGNAVPESPILFMKPSTAVVRLQDGVTLPVGRGECHHETEVTVLIGRTLRHASPAECHAAIAGIGLGLDLTLRDVQNELKKKGYPWEVAKAFDGAAPLSGFLRPGGIDPKNIRFSLRVNGAVRQSGHSVDMITPILPLLAYISTIFTLEPGDVVMTGTPEGVAPLQGGDALLLEMDGLRVESVVA
ncbi:MAG TPA: fumarylacetoacetate hydrolase family protein [Moraxellaceae bacterium]|nr:fumarylacetoacetate hydrolase family protein [Moraxellaceae bacterium]